MGVYSFLWFPISLGSTSLIFDALISLWDGRNFFVLWNVEELREETPRPLVVRIKVDWCTGWWVFVNIATNFSPVFFKVTINWGLWLWVLFGNNMCGIGTQVKSESAPNNHGIYRRGPFFGFTHCLCFFPTRNPQGETGLHQVFWFHCPPFFPD